ncbi:MAG: hypothetical protein WCP03_01390 [Candidatus Saccharibacteria bacterium]
MNYENKPTKSDDLTDEEFIDRRRQLLEEMRNIESNIAKQIGVSAVEVRSMLEASSDVHVDKLEHGNEETLSLYHRAAELSSRATYRELALDSEEAKAYIEGANNVELMSDLAKLGYRGYIISPIDPTDKGYREEFFGKVNLVRKQDRQQS